MDLIKISDKLPSPGENVLFFWRRFDWTYQGQFEIGRYDHTEDGNYIFQNEDGQWRGYGEEVLYWCPLPELPLNWKEE